MDTPCISILLPVWNGLPYIKECIQSVLNQDFQDWELIVSDNGSSDGTREYLNSLSDHRIHVFNQEKNLGILGNVNFLFTQARCPISQMLCADDYFTLTNSLSVIVKYWESAAPEIGFVSFSTIRTVEDFGEASGRSNIPAIITPQTAPLWFFVFGNILGNLSNVSLRTHLVSELGGFAETLPMAGDFEFWSRASSAVSIGVEYEEVIYIRRHFGVASLYLNKKGELYSQHNTIYERLINDLSLSYNRNLLIAYFNFSICAFHYRAAIKEAFSGRFDYLKRFIRTSSPINWPKWFQLIACLPFALLDPNQKLAAKMGRKVFLKFAPIPAKQVLHQA